MHAYRRMDGAVEWEEAVMIPQSGQEQIERLAEMLVLADATDYPALAALHTEFEGAVAWARSADETCVADVAEACASLVEQIVLGEAKAPESVLEDLGLVVANFQRIARTGKAAEEMPWPARFGFGGAAAAQENEHNGSDAASAEAGESPDGVDGVLQGSPAPDGAEADEEAAGEAVAAVREARPLEGDADLLGEFVNEAREHLEAADINLLKLETVRADEDPDALNAIFRAFHTIKGVAGFLALDEVQELAHEAENLLDRARKHELELAGPSMDVTFDAVDLMKKLIGNVSQALETGGLLASAPELPKLLSRVKAAAAGKLSAEPRRNDAPGEEGQRLGEVLVDLGVTDRETRDSTLETQHELAGKQKLGEMLVQEGKVLPAHVNLAIEAQKESPAPIGEVLVEMEAARVSDVAAALEEQETGASAPKLGQLLVTSGQVAAKDVARGLRAQSAQAAQSPTQVRETVRVDADRLDLLVDMIGELVIAESMVSQSDELKTGRSTELARSLTQLGKITRELQEMGTGLRMVPIRATFQKMARLVRDLAKKSGKQVEFVTTGEDTELDKSVVDKIGDPLVHMVRNAVDHGLEANEEERLKAGKQPVGRVELRAFHRGGSIYVEIQDDGRGLDREAILAKARNRGLVRDGETLTDREVFNLIFEPGLSTAKTVTDVSGRGVGMDVVRRNIETLRGQVDIQSHSGTGSTFSIRLPLTLAIIDGMVVRVGNERYILPTLSIVMSIRPEANQISTVVGRGETMLLHGKLLPLFRLAQLFAVPDSAQEISSGIVVVVEDEGRRTGFLVDEILGQQQTVIKSLGSTFQEMQGIAGGAIMSDGTVGLILDVGGLLRLTNEPAPRAVGSEGTN